MSKRAGSPYQPGKRGGAWLKVKSRDRQEFVIAGYTLGKGRRSKGIGALILAVERDGDLVYVGNCGTGFDDKELDRLQDLLDPLRRDTCPLVEVPRMPRVRTTDVDLGRAQAGVRGRVRRVDVGRAAARTRLHGPARRQAGERGPPRASGRKGRPEPPVSNLDKVFWPDEGITKGDVIDYYRQVADVLVPHLRDRPFTMKRYPDGIAGNHFFQKDAPKHMPDWIPTAAFPATSREDRRKRMINYPLVNEAAALVWMANMGCIDMNAWYSRADKPERPDFVLFDLDPTPEVGFAGAVEAAQLVKVALDAIGLRGYPKTSGADGIHVLVPLVRRYGYDDSRKLSATLARALADVPPGADHHGVVEGPSPRRPDRREPERARAHDRIGLLRAAASGCAGVDARRVGRAHAEAHARGLHDGRGARPDRRPGRPLRAGARGPPGARPGASQPLSRA